MNTAVTIPSAVSRSSIEWRHTAQRPQYSHDATTCLVCHQVQGRRVDESHPCSWNTRLGHDQSIWTSDTWFSLRPSCRATCIDNTILQNGVFDSLSATRTFACTEQKLSRVVAGQTKVENALDTVFGGAP